MCDTEIIEVDGNDDASMANIRTSTLAVFQLYRGVDPKICIIYIHLGHNRKKSQQQRRVEETCACPMCHEA
jgi:hypothetical protein